MDTTALQRNQQQVKAIHDHLLAIRRNMEGLISENRQLRDDLARAGEQIAALRRQNQMLQERDQQLAARHEQLSRCVDDALDQVERALAQVASDAEGET